MLKSFVLPDKFWLLIRNIVPIYCFKVASLIEAFLNYSQNLSRFFTVQLSMFVVVIFNSLYILSCFQVVVNNFLFFLCCLSNATTLISYHVCHCLSTTFLLSHNHQPSLSFLPVPVSVSSSRVSLYIIARSKPKVNKNFAFYLQKYKHHKILFSRCLQTTIPS